MRVLLDNNVTHQIAPLLIGHEIVHARQKGWADLSNGTLISACEMEGFDVLVTADKGMMYQQNMTGRRLSIILVRGYRVTMRHLRPLVPDILEAIQNAQEGSFRVVSAKSAE